MFFSKTASQLNNHQMQPGESLFQYLKRKKHFQLKNTIQNSLHQTSLTPKQPPIPQPSNLPKSTQKKESARQTSTKRRGKKSSNKKKKVDQSHDSRKQNNSDLSNLCQDIFKNQQTTRRSLADTGIQKIFEQKPDQFVRKIPTRSFMSMISPLKKQANLQHSPYSRAQSVSNTHDRKSVKQVAEFNSKKMIKQAMTKVQRYCQEQIDFEKEIKQKMRDFFILLNSILLQFEDSAEDLISSGLQKKMKELRSSIKMINGYVSRKEGRQKEDVAGLIEEMYASVNQVLDSFEGQVKEVNQTNCQSIISRKQEQFEQKIDALAKERNDLSRQINGINKEYNKLQKQYNQLLQKYDYLQEENQEKRGEIEDLEKQRLAFLKEEIETLSEENTDLKHKIQFMEKKLKDSEYKFDEFSRRVHIEHQEKLTERQNYLLKEINLLKAECTKDITSLNNFYANREDMYPKKIKELQKTISDQVFAIQNLEKVLKDTEKVNKLQESNMKESRRKVEEVMTDLYRINQELYKHWLALKDVKTLLVRINMFDKFERIFKDIPFDEVLFLP